MARYEVGRTVNKEESLRGDGTDGSGIGRRQNAQLAYERVREAILSGELPAGEVISQVRLADRLGISRNPVREALRSLEREGLIESKTNHRARVAPMSASDLEELYAMRISLEALGIRFTVPRLSAEDSAGLNSELSRMEEFARFEDFEGWEVHHRAFHVGLLAHAGKRLVETTATLYDHAGRYRRRFMEQMPQAWPRSTEEHKKILDACEAGETDAAASLLARHYSVVALSLIARLDPEHEPSDVRTALRTVMHSEKHDASGHPSENG